MNTHIIKSLLVTVALLCAASVTYAQFEHIYIGVNGLTCSQCSRTVELSIRKLDFVADVQMNLEHTEGKVTLKKNAKADIEKVAQAVYDAGFSVRYLDADLTIDKSVEASTSCLKYKGDEYVFTEDHKAALQGTVKLKFIGKKYMPKNELKKMHQYMDKDCGKVTGKVYHVAIS